MNRAHITAFFSISLLLQAGTCGHPMSGKPQYDYPKVNNLLLAPYSSGGTAKSISVSVQPQGAQNPPEVDEFEFEWTKGGKKILIPDRFPAKNNNYELDELSFKSGDAKGNLTYGPRDRRVIVGMDNGGFSKNISPEYVNWFTIYPDPDAIGAGTMRGHFGWVTSPLEMPSAGQFVYHGEVADSGGKGQAKLTLDGDQQSVDVKVSGGFKDRLGNTINAMEIKGVALDEASFSGRGKSFSADVTGATYQNGHLDGVFYGLDDPVGNPKIPDEAAGFFTYDDGRFANSLRFVVD